MNPSFLSLCPDDNIKKKAVIPTAEYNRPVICQYTYRVSSVSTLLSELLFQTPEKRVHYTVSQHLYQVLINKLLIFLQLFSPTHFAYDLDQAYDFGVTIKHLPSLPDVLESSGTHPPAMP